MKIGKEIANKTAEYLAENTYHYTEEAKKIAERHMEVALQHWRTRMGKEWSIPRVLSENKTDAKTDAAPKQRNPQVG